MTDPTPRLRAIQDEAETVAYRLEQPHSHYVASAGAKLLREMKAELARLTQEKASICEFCRQPDGDIPSMLEVCPACWEKANTGSGWMQRALMAEQERDEARRERDELQQRLDILKTRKP